MDLIERMVWIMFVASSIKLALRAKVEVFTFGTAEPDTEDGLREDLLASNATRK